MRSFCAAALALAALLTISCGGVVDPSKNVTDTFTGTIAVQGTTVAGGFETSKTGEFTVKVTALTPSSNAFVGTILSYGASDGSCTGQLQPIQQNSFATVNAPALTGLIYPGKYCVFVFDIGTFTVLQNFTVTVSHP